MPAAIQLPTANHGGNCTKAPEDRTGVIAMREIIIRALRERRDDTRWPMRYAARRIAWHVLDHAWEIEDKHP